MEQPSCSGAAYDGERVTIPLSGGARGCQALGWVVDYGNEPTPALTRHPSKEGILGGV